MRSKKALINILSSLLLQVVVLICGFIVPKLIIKNYGSNVNGLISSITQFLAYISLLEAGVGPVIKATLYKPIARKDKKEIQDILWASEKFFRVIALIFLVYLIILAFVYPIIVMEQFSYIYTLSLVLIISISTLAEYYFGMTYRLYLQAEQKTYITSIIQMVVYILNIIAIVILVKCHANIQMVKLVSSFIFVIRPIMQNIYVRKKYNINLKNADKNYQLKQRWDGLAQHIASVIHNNTDVTILTIFSKISEVSVYSVYYLVIKGVKAVIQSFTGGIDASFGDIIAKNEKQQLNKSFSVYELFYFTIVTIAYTCTLLLIVPFIEVYTKGITDAEYIRPIFAILLVLGDFAWAIRLPYSSIVLAAGHFKETMKGAWVESVTNVAISLILVWKLGIVGVTIGTLVAMVIRTVEFIYHTNTYILERKHRKSIMQLLIIIVQVIITVSLTTLIPSYQFDNYLVWVKYACIILVISLLVIVPSNCLIFRNDTKELLKMAKNIIYRKKEST